MNPMALLKLKSCIEKFKSNHPKVISFFTAASGTVVKDSIIELKLTSPDGKTMVTNMRVTEDDLAMISEFNEFSGKQ